MNDQNNQIQDLQVGPSAATDDQSRLQTLQPAGPPLAPPDPSQMATISTEAQVAPASENPAAIPEMPLDAQDNDVIEKEWVIKAKEVIADTKQDPYRQVQAINRVKADYMKKRYDKDIKLADA